MNFQKPSWNQPSGEDISDFEKRKRRLKAERDYANKTKLMGKKIGKKSRRKKSRKGSKANKNKKKDPKQKSLLEFVTDKNSNLSNHKKLVARYKLLKHYGSFVRKRIKWMLEEDYQYIKLIKKH